MLRAAGLVALCSLLLQPQPTCMQEPLTGTEGGSVNINCKLNTGGSESTVYWFRVKDKTTDTLVAVNSLGKQKFEVANSRFTPSKSSGTYMLKITQFRSAEDRGLYSCATLVNNKMILGALTKVSAKEQTPTTNKAKPTEKTTRSLITSKPCNTSASVPKAVQHNPALSCDIIVWAPLSAGCGLLFLILIITITYCNKVRTRRCPHHYKRRPKKEVNGRPSVPDRYV